MDSQNNQDDLDVSFLTNNAINIDNMYEFISMLFENNEYDEDEAHDDMHALTQQFIIRLSTDIYAIAGGKGCKC